MPLSILRDPRLKVMLSDLDEELAEEARKKGCAFCGGRLDHARYPRKPRGVEELEAGWNRRESFCCAEEGCRRRKTPASVRFLARRVYLGVVVVLAGVLLQGVTSERLCALRSALGVDRRTLERWRRWWRESFPLTRFWIAARARFLPPVVEGELPACLLARFGGESVDGAVALLRFLTPISIFSSDP